VAEVIEPELFVAEVLEGEVFEDETFSGIVPAVPAESGEPSICGKVAPAEAPPRDDPRLLDPPPGGRGFVRPVGGIPAARGR
jgi:hypothetical protein